MRLTTPLYLALVEMDRLFAIPAAVRRYESLPQFPETTRDMAVVMPESVPAQAVIAAIRMNPSPWLEKIEIFDLFADARALGPGKRSLAFSLTYRDRTRTLTDDEVNRAHEEIKAQLARQLAVQFR